MYNSFNLHYLPIFFMEYSDVITRFDAVNYMSRSDKILFIFVINCECCTRPTTVLNIESSMGYVYCYHVSSSFY